VFPVHPLGGETHAGRRHAGRLEGDLPLIERRGYLDMLGWAQPQAVVHRLGRVQEETTFLRHPRVTGSDRTRQRPITCFTVPHRLVRIGVTQSSKRRAPRPRVARPTVVGEGKESRGGRQCERDGEGRAVDLDDAADLGGGQIYDSAARRAMDGRSGFNAGRLV